MKFCVVSAICLVVSGCASAHYNNVIPGELNGKVRVEWMEPDRFLFTPNEDEPLTFVRHNGTEIRPGLMYTDGGSIPRPLWVLKNYSPWGFGPAFIVHDWLFVMQDCQLPGADQWTIEEVAMVMSEVMKSMMESPKFDYGNKSTVYLMYRAVQSKPAQIAWSDHDCEAPPGPAADDWRPTRTFEVSFGE